jgi:hypothetical protein
VSASFADVRFWVRQHHGAADRDWHIEMINDPEFMLCGKFISVEDGEVRENNSAPKRRCLKCEERARESR